MRVYIKISYLETNSSQETVPWILPNSMDFCRNSTDFYYNSVDCCRNSMDFYSNSMDY